MKRWLLLLVLIVVPSVYSLGVAPAFNTFSFEPGLEETYTIKVYNSDKEKLNVTVDVAGDLSDYVDVDKEILYFSEGESFKEVEYSVSLPRDLPPGVHRAKIRLTEVAPDIKETMTVIGIVSLSHKITVNVPAHGKYLSVEPAFSDDELSVTLDNIGREDIDQVDVSIMLFEGEKEVYSDSERLSLNSGSSRTISRTFDLIGEYTYVVDVLFDGQSEVIREPVRIGEPVIDIVDIRSSDFELGKTAQLEVDLENKWNKNLDNVDFTFEVLRGQDTVSTYRSEKFEITGNKTVYAYWDTSNVERGTYTAKFTVNYLDHTAEEEWKFQLSEQGFSAEEYNPVIFGILIAFAVFVTIIMYLAIRSRMK